MNGSTTPGSTGTLPDPASSTPEPGWPGPQLSERSGFGSKRPGVAAHSASRQASDPDAHPGRRPHLLLHLGVEIDVSAFLFGELSHHGIALIAQLGPGRCLMSHGQVVDIAVVGIEWQLSRETTDLQGAVVGAARARAKPRVGGSH